jgi:hypothetical protein
LSQFVVVSGFGMLRLSVQGHLTNRSTRIHLRRAVSLALTLPHLISGIFQFTPVAFPVIKFC